MMEPAEDWNRCDAVNLLDPAKIRSIFRLECPLTARNF